MCGADFDSLWRQLMLPPHEMPGKCGQKSCVLSGVRALPTFQGTRHPPNSSAASAANLPPSEGFPEHISELHALIHCLFEEYFWVKEGIYMLRVWESVGQSNILQTWGAVENHAQIFNCLFLDRFKVKIVFYSQVSFYLVCLCPPVLCHGTQGALFAPFWFLSLLYYLWITTSSSMSNLHSKLYFNCLRNWIRVLQPCCGCVATHRDFSWVAFLSCTALKCFSPLWFFY